MIASSDPDAELPRRGPRALRDPVEGSASCSAGTTRTPASARGSPSLRDRLPADLRDGPSGPEFDALPFTPLYLLDDEWAAEIANRTVHGVMHLGWVQDESGGYRGQMAVYVKPNGLRRRGLHGGDHARSVTSSCTRR